MVAVCIVVSIVSRFLGIVAFDAIHLEIHSLRSNKARPNSAHPSHSLEFRTCTQNKETQDLCIRYLSNNPFYQSDFYTEVYRAS